MRISDKDPGGKKKHKRKNKNMQEKIPGSGWSFMAFQLQKQEPRIH